MIRLGLCVVGKSRKGKCYFHYIIFMGLCYRSNLTVDVDLAYLPEVVSVRFLPWKSLSPPFPRCPLWREVAVHSPHLKSRLLDVPPQIWSKYLGKLNSSAEII